ncbi:hypothetical protein ScPMuIL_013021 [Solemya velum]
MMWLVSGVCGHAFTIPVETHDQTGCWGDCTADNQCGADMSCDDGGTGKCVVADTHYDQWNMHDHGKAFDTSHFVLDKCLKDTDKNKNKSAINWLLGVTVQLTTSVADMSCDDGGTEPSHNGVFGPPLSVRMGFGLRVRYRQQLCTCANTDYWIPHLVRQSLLRETCSDITAVCKDGSWTQCWHGSKFAHAQIQLLILSFFRKQKKKPIENEARLVVEYTWPASEQTRATPTGRSERQLQAVEKNPNVAFDNIHFNPCHSYVISKSDNVWSYDKGYDNGVGSWDFMRDYVGSNGKFEMKRPTTSRLPNPIYEKTYRDTGIYR